MKFDAAKHGRRSIRLPKYDYTRVGAYFITICSQDRSCVFGEVVEGEVRLSSSGMTVARCWADLPNHYPHVALHDFVVMPNHIHGILELTPLTSSDDSRRHVLGEVIRAFKTFSARRINRKNGTAGLPVWQRNYYEHVIREEEDLARIKRYILENPLKWDSDEHNPQRLA